MEMKHLAKMGKRQLNKSINYMKLLSYIYMRKQIIKPIESLELWFYANEYFDKFCIHNKQKSIDSQQ